MGDDFFNKHFGTTFRESAERLPKNHPQIFTVAGHGNKAEVVDQRGGGKKSVDAKKLAAEIRAHPNWSEGKAVWLFSCSAGRGKNSLAQQLADILGTGVIANDDFVKYSNDKGSYSGYPAKYSKKGIGSKGRGKWEHFRPRS